MIVTSVSAFERRHERAELECFDRGAIGGGEGERVVCPRARVRQRCRRPPGAGNSDAHGGVGGQLDLEGHARSVNFPISL